MADEHWATFSIYDHRRPLYRQALLLYDRAMIPIPTRAVGDLSEEEIDALSADVAFLEEHGAARRFDWNPDEFDEFSRTTLFKATGQALSIVLDHDEQRTNLHTQPERNRDLQYDTRLHLISRAQDLKPEGVESVTPVPVYGSRERYQATEAEFGADYWSTLTLEIARKIEVPTRDVPLEDIIQLRESPAFRNSLDEFRHWQDVVLTDAMRTVAQGRREQDIREALDQFDQWLAQYREIVRQHNVNKVENVVTLAFGVGVDLATGDWLIGILTSLPQLYRSSRAVVRPYWKEVAEKACVPAGVVYEADQLFIRYQ